MSKRHSNHTGHRNSGGSKARHAREKAKKKKEHSLEAMNRLKSMAPPTGNRKPGHNRGKGSPWIPTS